MFLQQRQDAGCQALLSAVSISPLLICVAPASWQECCPSGAAGYRIPAAHDLIKKRSHVLMSSSISLNILIGFADLPLKPAQCLEGRGGERPAWSQATAFRPWLRQHWLSRVRKFS